MKKEYLTILIVGIVVTILILIIVIASQQKQSTDTSVSPTSSPLSITEEKTLSIQPLITDQKIFFPYFLANSNEFIYLADKGIIFYKFSIANKQKEKIFNQEVLGIKNVIYSSTGNSSIIFSNYPQTNLKLYKFKEKKIAELNSDIKNLVWTPDAQKIIYYFKKEDENFSTINIANPDGSAWQTIKKLDSLYENNIFLEIDNARNVYYEIEPYDLKEVKLYKLNIDSKEEKIIAENASYFSFSPDKQKIIIEKFDIGGTSIKYLILDSNGKEIANLDLDSLNISQMTWSKDSKYLYYLYDINTLVKIDIETGSKQIYKTEMIDKTLNLIPEAEISSLMISSDNKTLYFTYNAYLYKIDL